MNLHYDFQHAIELYKMESAVVKGLKGAVKSGKVVLTPSLKTIIENEENRLKPLLEILKSWAKAHREMR